MITSQLEVKVKLYKSKWTEIGKSEQKESKVNIVGIERKLHGSLETSQRIQK